MKRIIIPLLLSVMMVAYGPLATITSAEAATDAKVSQLKQKALQEIDRRLASLTKTQQTLESDIKLENEALHEAMSRFGMSGVDIENTLKKVALGDTVKQQSKDAVTKIIEKLTDLRKTVNAATTITELQEIGKSIDNQYKLDQVANAQGAVTKAVESLTVVFDDIKSTANDVQSRVSKLKVCTTSGGDTEKKEALCTKGKFAVSDREAADAAQVQLDNAAKMLSSIGSVLMSAVVLLETLVTSFNDMLGKSGDPSANDITSQSSQDSLNGFMASFTGITSQLSIATDMSTNAQAIVAETAGAMNAFEL